MSNMINQLKNEFRAGTLTTMASAIGENATRTQTALGAVLPALLGGLAKKAFTTEGANELLTWSGRTSSTRSPTPTFRVSLGRRTELQS